MLHLIIQTTSQSGIAPDHGTLDYTLALEPLDYEAEIMPLEYTLALDKFHYTYGEDESDMGQHYCMQAGSIRTPKVSFLRGLDSGELLTDATTAPTSAVSPSGLTVSSLAINAGGEVINGTSHAAGQALIFSVSGGTAGTEYTITLTAYSDATPAQKFVKDIQLTVD